MYSSYIKDYSLQEQFDILFLILIQSEPTNRGSMRMGYIQGVHLRMRRIPLAWPGTCRYPQIKGVSIAGTPGGSSEALLDGAELQTSSDYNLSNFAREKP